MKEKKRFEQLSRLEYLDWYILHKPECLKNYEGSPQVNLCIFIYIFHIIKFALQPFNFCENEKFSNSADLLCTLENGI